MFRDATSGTLSFGGGRYPLDMIKHADLGSIGGRLVPDFTYARAPSCVHHRRWVCPLAPEPTVVDVAVPVGETVRRG